MDNYSLFTNTTRHQDERMADDTKVVLYSILLVWSLIGNVLVIAVVFSNDIKTIFNGLIVNMAVSDLFVPLLALPLKIVESSRGRYNEWLVEGPLGETLCKLCYFFIDVSPAVSVFSLIIIAVHRFVAIVFPSSLKRWSGKIQRVLLMFTWVFSMALLSPYFYTFRLKHINGLTYCLSTWSPAFEDIPARTLFISILMVAVFLIPFLTITVLYVIMLKKLIQHSKTVENSFNKRQLCSRARRNKKIFYLSAITVIVFLILWGPFFCLLLTINFIWRWKYPPGKVSVVSTITFATQYLGYLNSAVNPCLYFIFLKAYREGFKELFREKSTCRKKEGKKRNIKLRTFEEMEVNSKQTQNELVDQESTNQRLGN